MAFLNSGNVKVFPTAFRRFTSSGKFTSEENFSNIINSIVDYNIGQDGYIIDYSSTGNNATWRVVIHGYYFVLNNFNISNYTKNNNSSDYNGIWLAIKIEQGDSGSASNALINWDTESIETDTDLGNVVNLDENDSFKGLAILNDKPKAVASQYYNIYSLQIIDKNGNVCEKNKAKINAEHVFISGTGGSSILTDNLNTINKNISTNVTNINKKNPNLTVVGINAIDDKASSKTPYLNISSDRTKIALGKLGSTLLDSISSKGRSGAGLWYTDGNGKAIDSTKGVGYKANPAGQNSASSGQFIYLQKVYATDGKTVVGNEFAAGNKFTISTAVPENNVGANGDIWFRY